MSTEKHLQLLMDGELEAAEKERIKDIPDYLYKFYALSSSGYGRNDIRRLKTLGKGNLWLNSLLEYNDPFEGLGIYFDIDKFSVLGIQCSYVEEVEKNLVNMFGTSSFTEEINNISMWAYYANNHKGFCVKFRIKNKKCFYKIHYMDKRIPICNTILKAAEQARKVGTKAIEDGYYSVEHVFLLNKYTTKHESWKNEKEYRLITMDLNEKTGAEIPFLDIGIEPVGIYTGLNCDEKYIEKLNRISKRLKCSEELKTAKIKKNDDRFMFFEGEKEREIIEKIKKLRNK